MVNIPEGKWKTIVESMPIASVDLVLTNEKDQILLGLRNNKPAKGHWFVPGGRVWKRETLVNAVERIAATELGIQLDGHNRLTTTQHIYPDSDVGEGISKHYVATAFTAEVNSKTVVNSDDQHAELQWFDSPPKKTHGYTIDYLEEARLL